MTKNESDAYHVNSMKTGTHKIQEAAVILFYREQPGHWHAVPHQVALVPVRHHHH